MPKEVKQKYNAYVTKKCWGPDDYYLEVHLANFQVYEKDFKDGEKVEVEITVRSLK
jgi:hypothetical protein